MLMVTTSDTKKTPIHNNDNKNNVRRSLLPMTETPQLSLKKFLHTAPYYYNPIKTKILHMNLTKYLQVYFVATIAKSYYRFHYRTMPPSNSNLQAMLQKGITGYLEETRHDMITPPQDSSDKSSKVPSTTNHKSSVKTKTSTFNNLVSSTNASTHQKPKDRLPKQNKKSTTNNDDELTRSATPPRSNSSSNHKKNMNDKHQSSLISDPHEIINSNISTKISGTTNNPERSAQGTNLEKDLVEEQQDPPFLDPQDTIMSPAEKLRQLRDLAKARKKAQIEQAHTSATKSKKDKRVANKKKKKSSKKQQAESALRTAKENLDEEEKLNDLNNTKGDTPPTIDVDGNNPKTTTPPGTPDNDTTPSDEDESESDDESDASNPYSILAQQQRKKKSQKLEKKRLKAIQRPFQTYITLKLSVKSSENPRAELFEATTAWLTAIQGYDSVVVYAYQDLKPTIAIVKPADIPTGLASFKDFFMGANPRGDAGYIWASLWLGHALEIQDLFTNFKSWLKKNDCAMYVKTLQEKNTVRDYFLLWSTQTMCTKVLHEATLTALRKVTKEQLSFAFTWAVIRREDGKYISTESGKNMGKQYTRALHIEVPKSKAELTYRELNKFFGSTSRINILFRRLRMVPVLRQSATTRTKTKINHLISLQRSYTERTETAVCYDITDLDTVYEDIGCSMREMIMKLRTLDGDDQIIFTSVDYEIYSETFKLTFPTALKSQAYDYIAQLPSFLYWLYGNPVLKLFTDAAVSRAIEAPWSTKEMCAISRQDIDLDSFAAEIEGCAWMKNIEPQDNVTEVIEDTEIVRKNEAFLFKRATNDGDVSTFHRNKSERSDEGETQTLTSPKKQRVDNVPTEDVDMASTTPDGRPIHTFEILLNDKEREILQLRQKIATLSASKDLINTNTNTEQSGLQDGLPPIPIDVPPGPEKDPGEHL